MTNHTKLIGYMTLFVGFIQFITTLGLNSTETWAGFINVPVSLGFCIMIQGIILIKTSQKED